MSVILEKKGKKAEGLEAAEIPNKETLEACQEVKRDDALSFTSLDGLFKHLKS